MPACDIQHLGCVRGTGKNFQVFDLVDHVRLLKLVLKLAFMQVSLPFHVSIRDGEYEQDQKQNDGEEYFSAPVFHFVPPICPSE